VLQFAFGETDSEHLPHRYIPNLVVYTGTHDNDTATGWFATLDSDSRERLADYLGSDGHDVAWDLVRAAFTSVADRAIAPLQDLLGLGPETRMNTPGQADTNWSWRVSSGALSPESAARLQRLVLLTGRAAPAG
jgi:4-alpha-glucanotransferase